MPHPTLFVAHLLLLPVIREQQSPFLDIRSIPKPLPYRNPTPEGGPRFSTCSDHFHGLNARQPYRKIYANYHSRTMSWREDNRRTDNGAQRTTFARLLLLMKRN